MKDPLRDIMEERARQDAKWGVQNHDDLYWLGILMEEVGETAQACIENYATPDTVRVERTRRELVQVSAVALAWLECIERRKEVRP